MDSLRYFLLANLLLAVVSGAFYILLRRETFFEANRLTLWLGLVGSLVLPLLELPDWRPQPVRVAMQQTAQIITQKTLKIPMPVEPEVTITFPNGRTYPAFGKTLINESWSWQTWLVLGYGAIVLLLLMRFGWQLASLMSLLQKSIHEEYDGFTLVRNQSVTSPFSFFRWVVLNPDQHDPDELEQILRHERVHVRARHSLDMIATELVCIVLWFNPAAYLFRRLVHQTLEFSADRAVLQEGVEAKAYQYSLVKVSLMAGRSTLTNSFSTSQIKERIAMLNKKNSHQYARLKYPVVAAVALTVATAFVHQPVQVLPQHVTNKITKITSTSIQELTNGGSDNEQVVPPISSTEGLKTSSGKPATTPQPAEQEVQLLKPSRYMEIRGDLLCWVITPMTTFEEVMYLKAELRKHGYEFEIDEIKSDMLHKFLVRMDASVSSGKAKGQQTTDDAEENKPMKSFGGQISISKPGILGTGEITVDGLYPTKGLKEIAIADEQEAQNIREQYRTDYLVEEGKALTKANWVSEEYDPAHNAKNLEVLKLEVGISFNELNQLRLLNTKEDAKFWLNNRLATIDEIQTLTLNNIYKIVTRDKFLNNQEEPHRIVLIYTK